MCKQHILNWVGAEGGSIFFGLRGGGGLGGGEGFFFLNDPKRPN